MTRREKLIYTRNFLRQWHTLDARARVPIVQWIALKWSCTETEARRLIAASEREIQKKATP